MSESVEIEGEALEKKNDQMKAAERKVSWAKLQRIDSLNLEAGRVSSTHKHGSLVNWKRTLSLAFQSIGIIYGDIGTSPLYVYSSTFTDGIKHRDDIIGVLSLIIYTITIVPMLKYVFIVLWANDNGNGGTFALCSLICRYAKVSLIPNNQPEDAQLSNYKLAIDLPSNELKRAQKIKKKLENSKMAQYILFTVTIMGTSMVIGDGILTPSISVLSAVSGIDSLGQNAFVGISVAILIVMFSVQRFGTDKVGCTFAPIVMTWFLFISGIGLYNLFVHDIGVLRAFNPMYIIQYFQRNGKKRWISLGGVVLCITGTEAMFADLGHFSVKAVQISFSFFTFPALIMAYSGQAAYLRKFPDGVSKTFYNSIPDSIYWPTFVVAVSASIIASQAMISGAFQIIAQALRLGCFPRVKVVHTSAKYEGQVYIPELNYMIMTVSVIVTLAFQTTEKIGNAYGIAVVSVFMITSGLMTLIMLVIWKTNIWLVALFYVVLLTVESTYIAAVMYKFIQGGCLPVTSSLFIMSTMAIWHYVHKKRYMFEHNNKVSSEYVKQLASNPNINRVPGIALLYSELVQGIPPIFSHFVSNIPSIHSVVVIMSIKRIPLSKVAAEERFLFEELPTRNDMPTLFRQLEPTDYRMFRCVARYGYSDRTEEPKEFEKQLIENLKEFIRQEHFKLEVEVPCSGERTEEQVEAVQQPNLSVVSLPPIQSFNSIRSVNSSGGFVSAPIGGAEEEMQFVQAEMEKGIVYLLGETEVVVAENASFFKKLIVNYVYDFLRKNFRQGENILKILRSGFSELE